MKKYFLPPNDVILSYNIKTQDLKASLPESAPRLYFGIHNYELQGLLRLDYAFKNGVQDRTYLARRENAVFVGVSYEPDDFPKSKAYNYTKFENIARKIQEILSD